MIYKSIRRRRRRRIYTDQANNIKLFLNGSTARHQANELEQNELNQQETVDCEAMKRNERNMKRTKDAKPGGKPLSLAHTRSLFLQHTHT